MLFPPCATTSPASGRLICRSACQDLATACAAEIKQYGVLLSGIIPDCNALNSTTNQPLYPITTYTADVGGVPTTFDCFAPNESASGNETCPASLARAADGTCFFKCPQLLLSDARLLAMKISCTVASVVGSLGWAATIISTCLRYGRQGMRWPHGILFFLSGWALLLNLSYWISVLGGFERVWCVGDQFATQSHSSCAAQGAIFTVSFYAAAWWVFFLALNLVISFTVPRLIPPLWLEITAHVLSLGVPLITTIIGVAKERVRYSGDTIVCFLSYEFYHSYLYPIAGLIGAAGVGLIVAVCYVIAQSVRLGLNAASSEDRKAQLAALRKHLSKTLKSQWRLLLLAAFATFGLGLAAGCFLYQQDHGAQFRVRLQTQFFCLANGGTNCNTEALIPFPLYLFSFLLVLVMGLLFGIITFEKKLLFTAVKGITSGETDSTVIVFDQAMSTTEM